MALETCFRAWALQAPAGGKDRLLLVGSSSTSFAPSKRAAAAPPLSVGRVATRRPRHVCQSKNAVDEGMHVPIDCLNLLACLLLSSGT